MCGETTTLDIDQRARGRKRLLEHVGAAPASLPLEGAHSRPSTVLLY
jgi:hypothetical protein